MEMVKFLTFLFLFFSVMACSSSSDEEADSSIEPPGGDSTELKAAEDYYNTTLNTVIVQSCSSCHQGYHSGSNSRNYGVFDNARSSASMIFNQVNSGGMPKGGTKLPLAEIDKFEQFKDLVNLIP